METGETKKRREIYGSRLGASNSFVGWADGQVKRSQGVWHPHISTSLGTACRCLTAVWRDLAFIRTKHRGRYFKTPRRSQRALKWHSQNLARHRHRPDPSRAIRRDNQIVLFIYIANHSNIDRAHHDRSERRVEQWLGGRRKVFAVDVHSVHRQAVGDNSQGRVMRSGRGSSDSVSRPWHGWREMPKALVIVGRELQASGSGLMVAERSRLDSAPTRHGIVQERRA